MVRRLKLQTEMSNISTVKKVYFQPQPSLQMEYPCIRYSLGEPEQKYAGNMTYKYTQRYDGVIIDRNPESAIPKQLIAKFPMCKLGKPYIADNLNHFPFTLYY